MLIGQLVNLVKDGQPVRMGKRAGNVVTLEDLVEAVGVDAARYALERSSSDAVLDIDLDLLVKHSNDNPVYYVQYAHARTSNVPQRGRAGSASGSTSSTPTCSITRPTPPCSVRSASSRGSSRPRPNCAPRTESRTTSNRWPATYHRWYDTDECRVAAEGGRPDHDANRTRSG